MEQMIYKLMKAIVPSKIIIRGHLKPIYTMTYM